MSNVQDTIRFYKGDLPKQLFPLDTNRVIIECGAELLKTLIYDDISPFNFSPQTRVYADKPGRFLRRTLKFDPIAEFALYDIVYRHRHTITSPQKPVRQNFAYGFSNGLAIPPASIYRQFREDVQMCKGVYAHSVKADIANYFNSIYHHDLQQSFKNWTGDESDSQLLGRLLRETNSGRSIDCLPHGIYPAKILGSHFLRFIDESIRIKSSMFLRFMDDMFLFDDSLDVLQQDFDQIQRILGEKNLSLNSSKTDFGSFVEIDYEAEVDEVRERLLIKRSEVLLGSGAEAEHDFRLSSESLMSEDGNSLATLYGMKEESDKRENDVTVYLDDDETEYLLDLLRDENIEEEDAELVLAVLRDHSEDVLEYLPTMIRRFPALSKNLYYFCEHIDDRDELLSQVISFVRETEIISEYQLFWLAQISESYLSDLTRVGEVYELLFTHKSATEISKAKILEVPESRYGMPEMKEEQLRTGSSNWLSWSSAVGMKNVDKSKRNHLLKYFRKAGKLNEIIADCLKDL